MNHPILDSGFLRLAFIKKGDRYAQQIDVRQGTEFLPLWESVEGDDSSPGISNLKSKISSSPAWPPSPPFQEVYIETRADGKQIALAVGRAGTSHWSLSVVPFTIGSGFVFDVACRVKERPEWLGSSYRRLNRHKNDERISTQVEFAFMGEFEEQFRLEIYPDRWNICPADLTGSLPRTIRWQYQVSHV